MPMPNPPDPTLHAIVLCDRAIQEKGTNKYTLVGTFTEVKTADFPAVLPELAIYACIAGARGQYELELQFVFLDSNQILASVKGVKFESKDPLKIAEFAFSIRGMVFPNPGKYEFRFLLNDRLIGHKPLWAVRLEGGTHAGR